MADQFDDLERLALQQHTGAAPVAHPVAKWAPTSFAAKPLPKTGTIATAQSLLTQHGFSPGHPPNGKLTAGTQNAIQAFQAKNKLPVTGTLDTPTQRALSAPPSPSRMGPGKTSTLQGGLIKVSRGAQQAGTPAAAPPPGTPPAGGLFATAPAMPSSGAAAMNPFRGTARGAAASSPQPTAPTRTSQGQQTMDTTMYESAGKRVPIVFSSNGNVAANGGTQDITVTPQLAYRTEALTVDAVTAAWFSIRQIKIGVTPQNAGGTGDIPATIFPPTQTASVAFECDLCNAGTQITLTVVNYDTAAHPFVGTVWGHQIQPTGG